MLISYASVEVEYWFEVHKTAINAARSSSVSHIFYSSLAFAGNLSPTSVASVMGTHLLTEQYLSSLLAQGPATYTAIREGLYSESFPVYTEWFDIHNPVEEITTPHSGDGPGIAWAKTDELGEATAKMIVSYVQSSGDFPWLNKAVLLSGPQVLSLKETVDILGRVTGKDMRIKEISAVEYAELPFKDKYWYPGVNLLKDYTSCWEAFRRRKPEDFETTVRGLLH
ncbi:hypothetical protein SI65_00388 [Aspergillus cristatus]|uniref:NmrA-like domain-containing protein n=1 Tax=Aspergillus cristatus TaxID=573508 RepID=A0A1E3BPC8_ASPCR|nr:hypothetical protein SI65_00388 [Aspergillus cristatus]